MSENNEKYGIELELLTDIFERKMEGIKKQCSALGKTLQSKTKNEVRLNDETAKKQIQQLTKEIEALQKKIESKAMKLEIDTSAFDKLRAETSERIEKDNPNLKLDQLSNRTYYEMSKNNTAMQLEAEAIKLQQELEKDNLLLATTKEKLDEIKETGLNVNGQEAVREMDNAKSNAKLLGKELNKIKNTKLTFGTTIKDLNKGLNNATSKIKKFAFSLLSIRSIYSLVSRASSAYLSQDTELANKLQAVWAGLGAMLAPIIEGIANVLIKAVKYINVFIKALTGVDLLAKAVTKSLKNTTNSAKSLNKALAGFDELNNLDTSTNISGMTNPFDAFGNSDLNPEWIKKIQDFATWVKDNIPLVVGIYARIIKSGGFFIRFSTFIFYPLDKIELV